MDDLQDFLEKELMSIIKKAVKEHGVKEKEVLDKLKQIINIHSEFLFVAKSVNHSTIIHKAERIQIGNSKKVEIVRDEAKYASAEDLQTIKDKVRELAELLRKAHENGLGSFHLLKIPFTFSPKNPYPSIYDELKRKFRYPKLELLPKEKVKKVLDVLNWWIGNVAYQLSKNGIAPYSKNEAIRLFVSACYKNGLDPYEYAYKRWKTRNLGDIDPLQLYKTYRYLLTRPYKRKRNK